jgi:hypothetical protein
VVTRPHLRSAMEPSRTSVELAMTTIVTIFGNKSCHTRGRQGGAKAARLDEDADRLVASVGGQQHVLAKPSQPGADGAGAHAASTDLDQQFRSEAPLTAGYQYGFSTPRPR